MHLPLALPIRCQIFLNTVTNQVQGGKTGDSSIQSLVYKRLQALLYRLNDISVRLTISFKKSYPIVCSTLEQLVDV